MITPRQSLPSNHEKNLLARTCSSPSAPSKTISEEKEKEIEKEKEKEIEKEKEKEIETEIEIEIEIEKEIVRRQ